MFTVIVFYNLHADFNCVGCDLTKSTAYLLNSSEDVLSVSQKFSLDHKHTNVFRFHTDPCVDFAGIEVNFRGR